MTITAVLIFSGCFLKIMIIVLYNKFYEDSVQVSNCHSELIKQIKLRYSNQIKLELPITDAEKFVGRYIYKHSKIIKAVGILDMLSIIVMLLGIAINYEKQYFEVEVLFIAMFIYISVGLLVNADRKERIIINNIGDYLVNNMSTKMAAREHRVAVKESFKEEKQEIKEIEEKDEKIESENNYESVIIEEILKEFFTV